jgi:hypothetical protein
MVLQVAFFLVAKRLAIRDEELQIASVGLIDMRVVNLIDNTMAQCEPEATTGVISRPDTFFCARSPARLDPWGPERY